MPFLAFIPLIISLFEHIVAPIEDKSTITTKLISLIPGKSLVQDILNIFGEELSKATEAQKEEFQLKLASLTGQIQLDSIDESSESFFKSGYRPFIAWGLGINVILHCSIVTIIDILHMFHIEISQIAPIDTVTFSLISGILGLYMVLRTGEKVKGVN